MHHIIDPATGAPVRGTWRTVSVAAASCADANIATTSALVRAGAAPAWLSGLGAARPTRERHRTGLHDRRLAMTPILASGTSLYWYLTRSTGAVALLLLTVTVVLGVVDMRRLSTPRWPRFVLDSLHRNVSLLAMVFLCLHILTSVLDSLRIYPLLDAVIPFAGSYRPFWLGLGAVAFDLLMAVTITSLLRQRMGYASWRAVHWLTYASWPIALLHGFGTGSDAKQHMAARAQRRVPAGGACRRARPRDRRLAARTCVLRGAALGGAGAFVAVPAIWAAGRAARLRMGAPLGYACFAAGRIPRALPPAHMGVSDDR